MDEVKQMVPEFVTCVIYRNTSNWYLINITVCFMTNPAVVVTAYDGGISVVYGIQLSQQPIVYLYSQGLNWLY